MSMPRMAISFPVSELDAACLVPRTPDNESPASPLTMPLLQGDSLVMTSNQMIEIVLPGVVEPEHTRDDTGSKQLPILKVLGRIWLWNLLPNGRHAYFFNVWAGRSMNRRAFRARLRSDLTAVFDDLAAGRLTAQVAAEFPLERAAEAMRLAESGTVAGKIVLTA
jgi:hypothetical protein